MRELTIRPIGAVQKFVGGEKDPVEFGRELGVEAVLDGIVQHDGEKLRVTARLIRVADGVALWSGKFDHRFTDIFAMRTRSRTSRGSLSLESQPGRTGPLDQALHR